MKPLQIEYISIADLHEYKKNAKKHDRAQVEQIAESIRQFGMNDPIAVWKNNEIIEGHGRLMACELLGVETVPVIRLDSLTDEQRRAYMLAHNKLTMNTGFDLEALAEELESIENLNMEAFGFDVSKIDQNEWFDREELERDQHEEGNGEYNDFVDKFKEKKTTDDCYTPPLVYDTIAEWVANEYKLDRRNFVRPFYPGGDYQKEKYPKGCVVVDNPPFSILAEIINWYCDHDVRFFLFAPLLTLFSGRNKNVCYIACDTDITYENGARVNTGYITNLDDEYLIRTAPDLTEKVKKADKIQRQEFVKQISPRYEYPSYVVTSAMLSIWGGYGVDFRVKKGDAYRVSQLDAQKAFDKSIYGGGYILSERAKEQAEKAKEQAENLKEQVEREKAMERAKEMADRAKGIVEGNGAEVEMNEKTGAIVWKLSDREMEIVRSLGDV